MAAHVLGFNGKHKLVLVGKKSYCKYNDNTAGHLVNRTTIILHHPTLSSNVLIRSYKQHTPTSTIKSMALF